MYPVVQDADNGGGLGGRDRVECNGNAVLPAQFCCESKTALKIMFLFKKKKTTHIQKKKNLPLSTIQLPLDTIHTKSQDKQAISCYLLE